MVVDARERGIDIIFRLGCTLVLRPEVQRTIRAAAREIGSRCDTERPRRALLWSFRDWNLRTTFQRCEYVLRVYGC